FFAAALSAILCGGIVDYLGHRRTTFIAGVLASIGGFATAIFAQSWLMLLVVIMILGIADAGCQLASNRSLATSIPARRRGFGFGVKQAAVPAAIMLSGVAVPTIGATISWRFPFVLTGL